MELLVVISMIGLFATISLSAVSASRAKAHDIRRLSEMQSVKKALELYFVTYQHYPFPDVDGCGGWDVGNTIHPFFNNVGMDTYFTGGKSPIDVWKANDCHGYRYFLFPAGTYGCPVNRGPFYVLGVTDMESSAPPYPNSPGFSCPGRNWQNEFDWVTGAFER